MRPAPKPWKKRARGLETLERQTPEGFQEARFLEAG
jgi:hypothetical protein